MPEGVSTDTYPERPVPTTALIRESFTMAKDVAVMPPKPTLVVPVKCVPLMLTVVPVAALVGLNE